jgi:hypothetical protein
VHLTVTSVHLTVTSVHPYLRSSCHTIPREPGVAVTTFHRNGETTGEAHEGNAATMLKAINIFHDYCDAPGFQPESLTLRSRSTVLTLVK